MAIDLTNYRSVPERIAEFREKHPDGSLQPLNPAQPYTIEVIDGATFIVYAAVAHRGPNDKRPGIGIAWEPFPGKTPYTRDSELQNAETSAWGRAIVATLASDTQKGIATAEDVRNRQADQEAAENGDPYRRATLRPDITPADVGRMRVAELTERLSAADLSPNGSLAELRARLTEYLGKTATEAASGPSTPSSGAETGAVGAGACAVCTLPIYPGDAQDPDLAGVETEDGQLIHAGCAA